MVSRRRLLIALGANLLSAPLASFAQPQGKVWHVGFMASRHLDFVDSDYNYGPFRQGMRELGYVEGKNLIIEWRSAEGKLERLSGIATELVKLKLDGRASNQCGAESHRDDSDCHGQRRRPGRQRIRKEPATTCGQHYRFGEHVRRRESEAA